MGIDFGAVVGKKSHSMLATLCGRDVLTYQNKVCPKTVSKSASRKVLLLLWCCGENGMVAMNVSDVRTSQKNSEQHMCLCVHVYIRGVWCTYTDITYDMEYVYAHECDTRAIVFFLAFTDCIHNHGQCCHIHSEWDSRAFHSQNRAILTLTKYGVRG